MKWGGRITVIIAGLLVSATTSWAHDGHSDLQMWRACDGAVLDATCSFENAAHDKYHGTCRSMSGDLVCVRNRPIERAARPSSTESTGGHRRSASPWGLVLGFVVVGLSAFSIRTSKRRLIRVEESSR